MRLNRFDAGSGECAVEMRSGRKFVPIGTATPIDPGEYGIYCCWAPGTGFRLMFRAG